ncbi:MAG TPA: AraC family transcriptional regulator [Phyllobacterium sp.]|nr:AraC family transcriptional regulator [Phyllobacterium sp.]
MSIAPKIFQPSSLCDIVDAIGDLDIPDGETAKAFALRHPPSTSVLLIAQYRTLVQADWQFGLKGHNCNEHPLSVTQIQTGVVSVHPRGPLGVIVVYLKPEAAARILGAPLEEFADTKIDLRNILNIREVSLLEEMLAESRDSAERVAHVEAFLLRHMRRAEPESAASRAAMFLRRLPALSVWRLASKLDISERHLSRSFQAMFGTSPKRFARIARVEKVLAARRGGSAWADIAYACGFADQAHMIRDFNDIVGQSPRDFLRPASSGEKHTLAGASVMTYAVLGPVLTPLNDAAMRAIATPQYAVRRDLRPDLGSRHPG